MRAILQRKCESGELVLWEPQLMGESCSRTMFVARSVYDDFDPDSWTDRSVALRFAQLAADFDRFVTGEFLPVGMNPREKDRSAYLARVEPVEYGIWALRSTAPLPAIRVFGAFSETDVFVALVALFREELSGAREWNSASVRHLTQDSQWRFGVPYSVHET